MKHGTRGTQQRVNKHSRDNWCQKSPTFLWSFVWSEKMFVFCDSNSLCRVTGSKIITHTYLKIINTPSSNWCELQLCRLTQALHHNYCHVIVSQNLRSNCVFLFFITACGMRGPAKVRRISHICDWVLRDWDNVWHCGSKLIPARIIIRSSSDKSVMICDTQRDRDLAASQRCERLCYLESGWVSWYSSLSETIKTFIKLENRGENN